MPSGGPLGIGPPDQGDLIYVSPLNSSFVQAEKTAIY